MTIDTFWSIIDGLDHEEAEAQLTERLEALSPPEIVEFGKQFYEVFRKAYNWKLWGAAYLIDGGCSDDGFMDFRYGLISRGRTFFESVLADPDTLAEVLSEDDFIPNEGFGSVAYMVYESKTGQEMPGFGLPPVGEPHGESWDFDDEEESSARLPKVSKRYNEL